MADQVGLSLDEYVRETLLAIVGGVLSAQEDERCGVYIGRSPSNGGASLEVALDGDQNIITKVSFDLATTVESKDAKGGGIAIRVLPMLSGKVEGQTESAASSISRPAFHVPISIPKPNAQLQADAARNRKSSEALARAAERARSESPWGG